MTRRRRGFTLVEVVVGLAMTGLTLVIAHGLLFQLVDAGDRLATLADSTMSVSNRIAWLERSFGSLITSEEPRHGFRGIPSAFADGEGAVLQFETWLRGPTGPIQRTVRIQRVERRVVAIVSRAPSVADTLTLWEGMHGFGAEYLREYGAGAVWITNWSSPVAAPLAVRMRVQWKHTADTLVFAIGGGDD